MKSCEICEKTFEEVEILEGIAPEGVIKICAECAEELQIPLLKKPSTEQLKQADKHYSVRERMENISGYNRRNSTQISPEQETVHRNLGRLRTLPKKQKHENLIENYDWKIKMARRRKKLTPSQLSEKSGVFLEVINSFEKGILPANFEDEAKKLENVLDIQILKIHPTKLNYTKYVDDEKEIIEKVKEKMNSKYDDEDENKENIKQKIQKGEMDFSKRQNLENVTLKDLIEMKKQREKKQQEQIKTQQEKELFGDDEDLELDLED